MIGSSRHEQSIDHVESMTPAARHLAIVTGASRGLGRLITIELAGAGVDVLMVGRDEWALAQTAEAASKNGASLHPLVCDLSRPEAAELVVLAARQLGAVDILVNNAAVQGPIGPVWETDFAAFEKTMRVDFLVPVALMRAVLPEMLACGAGWIVNISGGGATAPRPMFTAYGAAKTALVRVAETVAAETAGKGVRVNSIAPGAFASEMTKAIITEGQAAGELERKSAERILTSRDDTAAQRTAKLVAYLVTGPGRDVTGKLISTLWDPWTELHERWDDIRGNDVYTLRRIVPADRKLTW
jgi:NAD(P)-dependent dehydrogenase (short-subunit alcohol dehydrogenase family)